MFIIFMLEVKRYMQKNKSNINFLFQNRDLNSIVYAKSTKKFYVCGSEVAVFDDWYTCVGMLEKTKDFNFLTFKLLDSLAGKWR